MKQRLQALRKQKNAGVAMITLLCASAVFLALAAALTYAASSLLANANTQLRNERCYQLAKTFSEAVGKDLCVETAPPVDEKSVYHYANSFLDDLYNLYDPDHINNTTYSYSTTVGGADAKEEYGTITVRLFKEETDTDAAGGQTVLLQMDGEGVLTQDSVERMTVFQQNMTNDYRFSVQVTAALGKDSYRYSTRYYRMVQYAPKYTLNDIPVFYVGGIWSKTESGSSPVLKSELQNATIEGSYDVKKVVARKFIQEGA